MEHERSAHKQAMALQAGIANLRDMCGEDEDLLTDMIDGELDLDGFADRMLALIGDDEAMAEAIRNRETDLAARRKRFAERAERLRVLLGNTFEQAGISKSQRPEATISVSRLKPGPLITDESDIPAKFWKPSDPRLDRAALREAVTQRYDAITAADKIEDPEERKAALLKIDEEHPAVPGVTLDNGKISVTIRRK